MGYALCLYGTIKGELFDGNAYFICEKYYVQVRKIDDLIVNSKYKGKGYGKQILLWALKNIQNQRPILHVAGWNEKAVALYKNIGFEIKSSNWF